MEAATSPWHGRRALVTGCTGFLGGAVTRELVRLGATVVGLVRNPSRGSEYVREVASGRIRLVYGRVEDSARLHAAMAVHEVSAVFELTDSGKGLDSATRAAGLYHARVPVVAARPTFQLRIAGGDATGPTPLGVARFGELFGPRDRKQTRLVPRTAPALLAGETPALTDGPARDFVFVRDAARACLLLAEEVGRAGHALDCTFRSGWELTDRGMARLLSDVVGANGPEFGASELNNPCGWRPELALTQTLAETLAWYKQSSASNNPRSSTPTRRAA
jgi:nucleoside-diphosphate-sugar epimerase